MEGEHGGLAWSEVNTRDAAAACDFYGKLFGLTPHKLEDQEYFIMQRDEEMFFGVLQMDEQWGDLPPHWMGYFAVDNTDAALERVLAAGGSIGAPAVDTPYGRMAVIARPLRRGGQHFAVADAVKVDVQSLRNITKCNSLWFWLTQRRKDRKERLTRLAFLASFRENCELLKQG